MSVPKDKVLRRIRRMGFLTVRPVRIEPAYYLLGGSTVLKIGVVVHSVRPDSRGGFFINMENTTATFAPPEMRGKPSGDPGSWETPEAARGETVTVRLLREGACEYEVSDGTELAARVTVLWAKRTGYHSSDGEPVFATNINVRVLCDYDDVRFGSQTSAVITPGSEEVDAPPRHGPAAAGGPGAGSQEARGRSAARRAGPAAEIDALRRHVFGAGGGAAESKRGGRRGPAAGGTGPGG